MSAPLITVVYLFRKGEDVDSAYRFFKGVRVHSPGCEAEWLLLLKGFEAGCGPDDVLFGQIEGLALEYLSNVRAIRVLDSGFDLGSYKRAAEHHVTTEYVAFFNSHSEPVKHHWLLRLLSALEGSEKTMMVGATASHEGVPDAPFPNPHLRTNAFAMRRSWLLSLNWPTPNEKHEANQLEAGPNSLTSQTLNRGYAVLIVNSDGEKYDVKDDLALRTARVFRWGSQEKLLVADNRTRAYEGENSARKAYLETLAWGEAQGPDRVAPTIIIPSFRKDAKPSDWNDLRLAVASAHYYAPQCPVLVAWEGEHCPVLELEVQFPNVTMLKRPVGLSGPAAYNWCVRQAKARHVIIFNDDAVLHPDTVARLIEDWTSLEKRQEKIGFLGCRSNFIAGEGNIRHAHGGTWTGVAYSSEDTILPVETVFPVCALIDKDVYLEAGGFQPEINWYADNLLCFDLAKQGYRHFVSRAYVHHVGMRGTRSEAGRSMAEENSRSLAWLAKNRPDYFSHLFPC